MTISIVDLIITVAYFSIPLQIVISLCQYPRLAKKAVLSNLVVLLVLFALFIFLCGAGHLLRCLDQADTTFFHVVNIATAAISLLTAVYLIPFIPSLLLKLDQSLLALARSTKIVESMYPAPVRERLLSSVVTSVRGIKVEDAEPRSAKARLKEFVNKQKIRVSRRPSMEGGGRMSRRNSGTGSVGSIDTISSSTPTRRPSNSDVTLIPHRSAPIADSFPAVSILFADIVGFTSWSSHREPSQVFELLETLFSHFDRIARDLGVFKVETIGDCYVAVTGCPDADDKHAVTMARFADALLTVMTLLTQELQTSLGPGTTDLRMRVGIHSGAITAGVLRGDKSRFQLFGDTMNTASRMESTGQPHCIQVSQQTADLLNQAGKQEWLTPRAQKIQAKGKGELQTYWLSHVVSSSPEDGNLMKEKDDSTAGTCSLDHIV